MLGRFDLKPALLLALAAAFASMAVVFVIKTFADTVFLSSFGVEYVPHFYVAQSAALIGTSFLYTWVIRRAPLAMDAAILVTLAAASFAGPWLATHSGGAMFGVALALITLSTLGQMAVWNTVTSVVSGRKSRTFLPQAGAAATAGAVAGGFASSGIVGIVGIDGLAWVGGGLTLGTLILRVMLRRLGGDWRRSDRARQGRPESARESARQLVWLLAASVIVEAVLSGFIDFGFKRDVTRTFTSQDQIGVFFALYYGITNVALLATQLLTASRLLATRSLRFTLSLQPVALVATALLWAVFPILAIAALNRGVEGVLKFAVARPGQEVAMTPLSELTRRRLKVILRGVFAPGGAALAGGLLIAAGPLLDMSHAVVPAICAACALGWWWLSRATSGHYLATLGSELGLRRMSRAGGDGESPGVVDRDALGKLVELTGSEDRATAEFARDMLSSLARNTAVLAPHVGSGNASTRRAMYELLVARPSRTCAAKLRISVEREPDDGGALDAGLLALAAHSDESQLARARALIEGTPPGGGDDLQRAAWTYLSRVGALDDDPDLHRTALLQLLAVDGIAAAAACVAAIARGAIAGEVIDDALAEAMATDADSRRQALIAAARLGRDRGLAIVVEDIMAGSPWAEQIASRLQGMALDRVVGRVLDPEQPLRGRMRLFTALRACDQPEVLELAGNVLLDPSPDLRDIAVRLLLSRHAEIGMISQASVERALTMQMDRFETYVRARPGYATAARESQMEVKFRQSSAAELTAEAFFLDELERCTERSLGRLCGLLALLGHPDAIYDAERALRAPTFKRRRQALDVLQEVVRGGQKARLLELLELYLMPPRNVPAGARDAVIALDPWLARCASGTPDPASRRMWALRSAILFDAVDGDSLAALADRAIEVEYADRSIVVQEGEPGDALYIVIDGVLAVQRGEKVVAQLGPGEAFGELALLDGEPRQATVRAQKASRLLRLPRDTFDEALGAHPEIGLGLVLGLVKWLRQGRAAPRSTLRQTIL